MRPIQIMRKPLGACLSLLLSMPSLLYAGDGAEQMGRSIHPNAESVFRDYFMAPIPNESQSLAFFKALTDGGSAVFPSLRRAVSTFFISEGGNLSSEALASTIIAEEEDPNFAKNPDNAVKRARIRKFKALNLVRTGLSDDQQTMIAGDKRDYDKQVQQARGDRIRRIMNDAEVWGDIKREILAEQEARVLELRLGAGTNNSKTLNDVGVIYHVTRERIRQIQAKATRKLRPHIKRIPDGPNTVSVLGPEAINTRRMNELRRYQRMIRHIPGVIRVELGGGNIFKVVFTSQAKLDAASVGAQLPSHLWGLNPETGKLQERFFAVQAIVDSKPAEEFRMDRFAQVILKHIRGKLIERSPDEKTHKLIDWLENIHEVERMLSTLANREAMFIKCYFGIGTGYPITLSEVARIHRMRRSRGQKILERAIRKLGNMPRA